MSEAPRQPPAGSVEAVIFDRDGVLAFFDEPAILRLLGELAPIPLPILSAAWSQFGRHHGWPRSLAEEAAFFAGFWAAIAEQHSLPAAAARALAAWDYKTVLRPFADALPTLALLKRRGLKIGVLSNFSLASLEPTLESMGLLPYVDAAGAAAVIGAAKPQPAAYAWIASALGVAPAACLFVDDEAQHVRGARDAGMRAYLLAREGGPAADGAPALRSLLELPGLLDLADAAHPPQSAPTKETTHG